MNFNYINLEGLKHFYDNLQSFLYSKYTTKEELQAAIANFGGFQVVSLNQQGYPDVANPSTKIIYLTKEAGSSKTDPYTEWICTNVVGPVWEIIGETTPEVNEMIGATASTNGTAGLVPAPEAGDQDKVLKGSGIWANIATISYDSVEEELHIDFSTPAPTPGNVVRIGNHDYPYVQIGNQLWITENLDYKFEYNGSTLPIGGSGTPPTPNAWYYDNNEADYGIDGTYKCGLLYNTQAAKYLEDNKSTLLPDGWRLPTESDIDALIASIDDSGNEGTKLKAIDGSIIAGQFPDNWGGTDDYGFKLLPSGFYYGSFEDLGTQSGFILNKTLDTKPYVVQVDNTNTDLTIFGHSSFVGTGIPIRLIKDVT